MKGFVHPEFLWLLLALIPLAMGWNLIGRLREGRLARFAVRENWPLLNRSVSTRARFHKTILFFLALIFSIVAAARPFWGTKEREVQKRGTNVIFAVDVSDSMLATDIAPTRLEYARTLLRQILVEIPGNRVGVMPFAGEAFLQCPLTTDYGIAREILGQLSTSSVAYKGTDIPQAINTAREAFDRSGSGSRLLVLLTDGEDHSEKIRQAAEAAAKDNIRIFALGIGSTTGAPIRFSDGTYKETREGTKVTTRLDAATLKQLATVTGGRAYIAGASGRLDPTPIVEEIRAITAEDLGQDKRVLPEERFQYPLALALLCLMIEGAIGERRATSRSAGSRRVMRKEKLPA